ncbi:hypothetical protein V8D89_011392, partial [Ganoderma adspersum]
PFITTNPIRTSAPLITVCIVRRHNRSPRASAQDARRKALLDMASPLALLSQYPRAMARWCARPPFSSWPHAAAAPRLFDNPTTAFVRAKFSSWALRARAVPPSCLYSVALQPDPRAKIAELANLRVRVLLADPFTSAVPGHGFPGATRPAREMSTETAVAAAPRHWHIARNAPGTRSKGVRPWCLCTTPTVGADALLAVMFVERSPPFVYMSASASAPALGDK